MNKVETAKKEVVDRGWADATGAPGANDPFAADLLGGDPARISLAIAAGAISAERALRLLPVHKLPSLEGDVKGQIVKLPSEGRSKQAFGLLTAKGVVSIPYIPPTIDRQMRDASKLGVGVVSSGPDGVFLSSVELNGVAVEVPKLVVPEDLDMSPGFEL